MGTNSEVLVVVEQGQNKLRENIEESGRLIIETEQLVSESRLFVERVGRSPTIEQTLRT
jgi:DNA polymerase III psi subunit